MKLSVIHVGETPAPLRDRYPRYPTLFADMFGAAGEDFAFENVYVLDGVPFPRQEGLEGVIITGSAAGVYEDHPWLDPLRDFIRESYEAKTPMLGVCFGHQIMADALGGEVRKSEKGWGLGRHIYRLMARPDVFDGLNSEIAIAASHQDQVVTPPDAAEVFLASEFTPNAGLIYRNNAAISLQPHPEFDATFARGLVEIRRGNPLADAAVETARESFEQPLDRLEVARALARFFRKTR